MTKNVDATEIVLLAKQICFEIEVLLANQNYAIDLEEEWNQKGPRMLVRFLADQIADEDFDVRKTTLIQNAERLKSWLKQCHNEYQRKWPNHVNEVGGSVPARRVEMFKHCADFIELCKKDVHDMLVLQDLAMMDTKTAQDVINKPVKTIVYDEKNPDHIVLIDANRSAWLAGKRKDQETQQKSLGGGVGIKM